MKKFLPIIALLVAAFVGWGHFARQPDSSGLIGQNDGFLASAFDQQKSGVQAEGDGIVVRMLPDDNDGSRHQRFIVRLDSGQTLLIAHNIDLAPRVPSLREGDVVRFNGEYEWNSKGGVIHWTHRDPLGRHEAGWLKHNGRTYQ